MPYRGIQLTPKPTSEQPGDIFPIDMLSGTVVQIRGVTVIQSWSVSFPGVLLGDVPPIPEPSDDFRWLVYFQERPMTSQSITCTGVSVDQNSGTIYFNTDVGSLEFQDFEAFKTFANSLVADETFAQKLIAMKIIARSPDGANLENMNGGSATINPPADVPVVITYPA